MKLSLNRLLIGIMLTVGSIIMPYTKPESLLGLEFYIGPTSCIPKYFFCTKTILPTNPDIDCFQWGKCQHLRLLEALIQSPITQMILKNNSKLNKSLVNILDQYGKGSVSKLLKNYSEKDIEALIKSLIGALVVDENVLRNAGLVPALHKKSTS